MGQNAPYVRVAERVTGHGVNSNSWEVSSETIRIII